MTNTDRTVFAVELGAALDWWRLAGVDVHTSDDAAGWLGVETPDAAGNATASRAQVAASTDQPHRRERRAATPGLAPVGSAARDWPTDLGDFQQWWSENEKFSVRGAYPKIPPRGNAGARLMVLVAHPEETDEALLLSGPLGAMLEAFRERAGLASEALYVASALPRHTLHVDWHEAERAGYGEVLAHHVSLVAPERLVVFGRGILSLLRHESPQASAASREFNHDGRSVPLLPARDLSNLYRRAGFRARFWQQWLEFTER